MNELFERAARLKLRFDTFHGLLTVEDLWTLPLTSNRNNPNLDDIAKGLHRKVKESETESFVTKTTSAGEQLQLSFDIVKHIIDVKVAEKEAAETRVANKEKKERILAILAEKQDEALKGKSEEELKELVAAL